MLYIHARMHKYPLPGPTKKDLSHSVNLSETSLPVYPENYQQRLMNPPVLKPLSIVDYNRFFCFL